MLTHVKSVAALLSPVRSVAHLILVTNFVRSVAVRVICLILLVMIPCRLILYVRRLIVRSMSLITHPLSAFSSNMS